LFAIIAKGEFCVCCESHTTGAKKMHHVIVKFLDGVEKKGDIFNFQINSPVFYLQIKNAAGKVENQPIRVDSVKQIFFLKKTKEDESILRKETIDQSIYAGVLPYKLVVELKDGEILDGSTNKYHPRDKGFFVVPLNPADKSDRIYINAKAVENVDCKRLLGKKLINQREISTEEVEQTFRQHREEKEKREREKREKGKKEWDFFTTKEFGMGEKESEHEEEIKPKPLGEILVEAGYITAEQLKDALSKQKKKKKRLGELLVELKYVTPTDICVALATQCHFGWVDLSSLNIAREVATTLPEAAVRKLLVIPVEKKEDILVVATSQPQDPSIGMKISKHTPLAVELVIAYEGYILKAIDRYFPKKK
jgi:hypothetical protein